MKNKSISLKYVSQHLKQHEIVNFTETEVIISIILQKCVFWSLQLPVCCGRIVSKSG